MANNGAKVAVGLSGGVDSSVAAVLLKEKGYNIVGITMEIFDDSVDIKEGKKHACYGPGEKEDIDRAASLCKQLKIPFYSLDLKKEYEKCVIEYFKREYLDGKTPNPCIVCNHKLKFGFLLDKAREVGIDFSFFATGHYARIAKSDDRFLLKTALDLSKDQSYFLYGLTHEQLSQTLFPLGEFTKQQVRDMARSLGLKAADLPESQDFIAGGDYSSLFNRGEISAGDIVGKKGEILGKHTGVIHYTVGQRKGLGIASTKPLYVLRIDAENNRIVVGGKADLFSEGLIAKNLNLISVKRLDGPCKVKAKVRLRHKAANATVFPFEKNKARIVFDEPQLSVSPGQSVVLYMGDTVIGGGVIEKAF